MTPRPLILRLPLWLLIASRAQSALSLALPAITPSPTQLSVVKRVDNDIATKYGFFDPLNSYGADESVGDSDVAHISEVFMAIAQLPNAVPPPTPSDPLASSTILTDPANPSITDTAVYPGSPPMRGPGLVVLSQPFPAIGTATPVPTGATNATSSPASSRTVGPTKRILILGSVIGSILLFTLCLFLVLDPSITGKLFKMCRSRKRPTEKVKEKENKEAISLEDTWVIIAPLTNPGDETFVESEKPISKRDKEDPFMETPDPSPPSKFSICSSEYSESYRNSAMSSNSAYASTPVKPTVSFVPGPAPTRPPRPPTADSPALSDSVYLACSDQPYVIVAPQAITEADMNSSAPSKPPKRMLTPSEFFALHVPGILSGFGSSASSSKKPERTSAYDQRSSAATKRDSYHSRTKSAPSLGHVKVKTGSNSKADVEFRVEGACQEGMVERITKHRRSRSASGWAYPDRPSPRKPVKEKI